MKKAILPMLMCMIRLVLPSFGQKKVGTISDFVTWQKAVVQFNHVDSSRFSAGAEFSYRRIENATVAQLFFGLACVKYTLPKINADIIATYALVHFYNLLGNVDLFQCALGKSFTEANSKLNYTTKIAADRIIFPAFRQYNRWRYRTYLGTGYALGNRLILKASDEFLLSVLSGLTIPENRAQIGLYGRIGKRMELGAAYFNRWTEQASAPNRVENTLLTEYVINL